MTEPHELETEEPDVPSVADVPEPDQDEHEHEIEQAEAVPEPIPDEADTPAVDQGAQQAEWERRFTRTERAFATYTKKVTEIYADDAIHLMPFNVSPSAPPGFIYGPDAGRVPEGIQAATFEFFGLAREQDYEPDPQTRECQTCKGKGKTKTGSHVAGKETRPCPTCMGSGAEGLQLAPVNQATTNGHDEHFTLAEIAPTDVPDADTWGEPRILPDGRENPNWGKMPQFKVPVEPWGQTAGLTAQDAKV